MKLKWLKMLINLSINCWNLVLIGGGKYFICIFDIFCMYIYNMLKKISLGWF